MGHIERSSVRAGPRDPTPDFALASMMRQAATLAPERRSELLAYLRQLDERCWVCNKADSEPVRLARRADHGRWASIGTVQLCSGCIQALTTPVLARSLAINRREPQPNVAPGWVDVSSGAIDLPAKPEEGEVARGA